MILFIVKNMQRSHNIDQLKYKVMQQIQNYEEYESFFDIAFDYLKNNGYINTGKNNIVNDTVFSLTEKGESVLEFGSWEEYLQCIKSEKQKKEEYKKVDLELKNYIEKSKIFEVDIYFWFISIFCYTITKYYGITFKYLV